MTEESKLPILRRFWRPRVSTIHRCPVHGIRKPLECRPGKCPHVRCGKTLLLSQLTRRVLE